MSTLDSASELPPPPEGNPAPSQIQPPPPVGYPTQAQRTQQTAPIEHPASLSEHVAPAHNPPQDAPTPPPVDFTPPGGYVTPGGHTTPPLEHATPSQYPAVPVQYAATAPYTHPTPPQDFAMPSHMQPTPPGGYYPPTPPAKRSVEKLIAIILLSVGLTVALVFVAVNVIQLSAANARISQQQREIQEQKDLIDKKETFGLAMNDLMDTAKLFDGVLMADMVPTDEYESVARQAWDHRWDGVMLDADTETAMASTRDLETLLSDAESEASTNATGSTYETVVDLLGGGHIASIIEDADTLCKKNILACVTSDNPYLIHFDAASNSNEYMNEWLRTGVAYHEFAHVLQFTNPTATDIAVTAFDGDHETMADCFALTYLDGWTLDHTVWMNSSQYWEVSIGYGYTCNESQRQAVRDWYGQLGYTTRPISQ